MEKKKYICAEIEIRQIEMDDILTASNGDEFGGEFQIFDNGNSF